MNKEQQDLAWQCLPKEARDRIRIAYKSAYVSDRGYYPTRGMEVLQKVFGHHNLTSDEEPSELLFVEREDVIAYFAEVNKTIDTSTKRSVISQSLGKQTALKSLFGDKCLPDKEPSVQVEPKFKVGDKVRVKYPKLCKGKIGIIDEIGSRIIEYHLQGDEIFENSWFGEDMLEPYTEPETKDNMEGKELNLCEILKGHENKTFYCSLVGQNVRLHSTHNNVIVVEYIDKEDKIPITSFLELYYNGSRHKDGECVLFPSKEQRDWNKWIEEQKPKTPKTWSELIKTAKATSAKANINVAIDKNRIPQMTQDVLNQTCWDSPIEKSALALLKIHQLIEVGYGGNVNSKEWSLTDIICPICHMGYNHEDDLFFIGRNLHSQHSPILFHTEKQAEEFLSYPENVQLLKDYFMIH